MRANGARSQVLPAFFTQGEDVRSEIELHSSLMNTSLMQCYPDPRTCFACLTELASFAHYDALFCRLKAEAEQLAAVRAGHQFARFNTKQLIDDAQRKLRSVGRHGKLYHPPTSHKTVGPGPGPGPAPAPGPGPGPGLRQLTRAERALNRTNVRKCQKMYQRELAALKDNAEVEEQALGAITTHLNHTIDAAANALGTFYVLEILHAGLHGEQRTQSESDAMRNDLDERKNLAFARNEITRRQRQSNNREDFDITITSYLD